MTAAQRDKERAVKHLISVFLTISMVLCSLSLTEISYSVLRTVTRNTFMLCVRFGGSNQLICTPTRVITVSE